MCLPSIGDLASGDRPADIASVSDAPALSRLLAQAFEQPWDRAWVEENLFGDKTVAATYVVRDRDRIVATASARLLPEQYPDAGYVHFVATAADVRGRGLGAQVTHSVLSSFVERDLHQAVLETDDERLSAISMYLGLGFVPVYREDDHVARWSQILSLLRCRPRAGEV